MPILIEILEEAAATGIQGVHRHPIWVVGQIGDDRAIPVLVKLVEGIDESEAVVEYDDYYHRNQFQSPPSTLAKSLEQLKAKQAVPQLLSFDHYHEVIESFANIGVGRGCPRPERDRCRQRQAYSQRPVPYSCISTPTATSPPAWPLCT